MAEKYYNALQEGKIYSITDGYLKQAQNYNRTDNDIEITFNGKTEIKELKDRGNIPT